LKVSINCHSLLLQKSLENFLRGYIVSKNRADFIISDREIDVDKPLFVVGRDVEKPFSRSRLFIELERFEKKIKTLSAVKNISKNLEDLSSLEKEIELLTKDFVQKIVQIVKKYNV